MLPHINHRSALNFLIKLSIGPVLLLFVAAASVRSAAADSDILYIGDITSNTVRRFDANTGSPISGGSSIGVFVKPGSGGLSGPRGLLVKSGSLLVVNQNVDLPFAGEVLRYKLNDGAPDGALVPSNDKHAPFAPRGIVIWKGAIYVADFNDTGVGRLVAFDERSGKFLREFSPPNGFAYTFHPRGLVIGPNGLLYVSNFPDLNPESQKGGQVLVFDPDTLDFIGAFIVDAGGIGQLNRPEGLVFGPDGNLYITSFRDVANAQNDTDSIRIYDGHTGVFKSKIDLYATGEPRAVAQALLFGPGGKLFVPISGPKPIPVNGTTGQVRRYDVNSPQTYEVFVVAPVGTTSELWYLTFGKTNPGTLAYEGRGDPPHAGGGDPLPPTEKPKGYSLSDIAKATAFFATSAPESRNKNTEPKVPFQILYTSKEPSSNTFSVRPGTTLYVPIFFATDSLPITGNFPDVADPKAVENYVFSDEELGAEAFAIDVDGKVTFIKEDSGYIVGVKVAKLADGEGKQYITAAVFLTPLTKGEHTVKIKGKLTGDALPAPFEFDITYTVKVN